MPCRVQAQWCGELPIEGVVQGVPWRETALSRQQLCRPPVGLHLGLGQGAKGREGPAAGKFDPAALRIEAMVAGNCEGSVSQVKASLQAGRREPLFQVFAAERRA